MGYHKQALRQKGRPDLVLTVGLLSVQEKSGMDGTRYGLVELEGRWETVHEDRPALTDDFSK